MPKFRKKPVVIDAFLFTDQSCTRSDVPPWFVLAVIEERVTALPSHLDVHTLEGTMRCDIGDWVIRGVKGEIYPCKPDIFAATYEPVGDGNLIAPNG